MASYDHSKNQNYIIYNDKDEVFDLDKNVWNIDAEGLIRGASGRHLYQDEPRHPAYSVCFEGRDLGSHYILGVERDDHPDHSSRFGYARCQYGYCSGHFPGKYIESDACSEYDAQPKDCAPARFYTDAYQGPYSTKSQAQEDYNYWKNYGMNLSPWWNIPPQTSREFKV